MYKELYFLRICYLLFQVIFAGTLNVYSDVNVNTVVNSQLISSSLVLYLAPAWVSIDGASWIWSTYDNSQLSTPLFIKCFNVPGIPTSSHISISADDYFTVILNGRFVQTTSNTYNVLTEIDMLSKTVQGNNCLHIIVDNGYGYGGLIFKVTINY